MKNTAYMLLLFISLAVGLSIVQIVFSTFFITGGIELHQMQADIDTLQRQNMILSEDLYSKTSLTNISKQAQLLGFSDNLKSRIAVIGPSAFALKQ